VLVLLDSGENVLEDRVVYRVEVSPSELYERAEREMLGSSKTR
jgi:hypothetical protein